MNILVINGTSRPEGTTTELARAFMEGAQSQGAKTDMILLRDCRIAHCTNCLKCYAFPGDGIAPCCMSDDMDDIVARIAAADGVLFASPVHCGFVSSLLTTCWDRLIWRVMRPAEPVAGCAGMRSRLDDKVRAIASIATSGGMPGLLRKYCDDGTRWLKGNAPLALHGQWTGDMYACADLERLPQTPDDWKRIYFLRRLSDRQRRQAREIGVGMVQALQSGGLRPAVMENLVPSFVRRILEMVFRRRSLYRLAR